MLSVLTCVKIHTKNHTVKLDNSFAIVLRIENKNFTKYFSKTVGTLKGKRLFRKRRSNSVNELFVHCVEMSDTKFVRYQYNDTTVRIRYIIVKTTTYRTRIAMSHTATSREIVLMLSEYKKTVQPILLSYTVSYIKYFLIWRCPKASFPFAFRFFVYAGKGINIIPALVLSPC